MTIIEAKIKAKKQRRKDILKWFRFLKREMKDPFHIDKGICISLNRYCMPLYGQKQAARLLCKKDNNFEIVYEDKIGHIQMLIWKHKKYLFKSYCH